MTDVEKFRPVDISGASNAEEAAEALQKGLQEFAAVADINGGVIQLWDAETTAERVGTKQPAVYWTGINDWPLALLSSESMLSRALGKYGGDPEIVGLAESNGKFFADAYSRTVMIFMEYNERPFFDSM